MQGTKRKRSDAVGTVGLDDRFLLRRSPSSSDSSHTFSSSASAPSSAKEMDEESSMDVELNFHLNLAGNEEKHYPVNGVVGARKVLDQRIVSFPKSSLSTGSYTSCLTSSPVSAQKRAEFSARLPLNFVPVASSVSEQGRPDVTVTTTLSLITSDSEIESTENESHMKGDGFEGCKERAGNASRLCASNDISKTCNKDGCQARIVDGSVYCKTRDVGYRKAIRGRKGLHRHCKQCPCIHASRGDLGPYLDCNRWKSAEGCHSHYTLNSVMFYTTPDRTKSTKGGSIYCDSRNGAKQCHRKCRSNGVGASKDFCGNHDSGRRCPLGHPGSDHGKGKLSCGQSSQGKTGLCTTHKALAQDQRVHGGKTVASPSTKISNGHGEFAHSEGRVHGGSLMAILKNGDEAGVSVHDHAATPSFS